MSGSFAGHLSREQQRRADGSPRTTVPLTIQTRQAEVPRPLAHELADVVAGAPGWSLDQPTRATVEPASGHDFAPVRVHAEAEAAVGAHSLETRAPQKALAAGDQLSIHPRHVGVSSEAPDVHGVLQRSCDCGTYSNGSNDCEKCQRAHSGQSQRAAFDPAPETVPHTVDEVLQTSGQPLGGHPRAHGTALRA